MKKIERTTMFPDQKIQHSKDINSFPNSSKNFYKYTIFYNYYREGSGQELLK